MNDTSSSNAQYYEIRLKGHLDARWMKWFDGMAINTGRERQHAPERSGG
jgi:hypothetical protein